jgi:hypothetical protein
MQTTIIRPGLLVSLKTTVRGGVTYQKRTIEADHARGAARVATWETTREIADADEHAAAIVARGKARTAVTRVCCASTFGLLCPQARESELRAAIEEAQAIANTHNGAAKCTRLEVFAITGRIADNDEQAARAISSEVRDLIAAMETGVRAADPEAIREAANKARALAGMLSPDAQTAVSKAIADVRSIARDIVRRVEKQGEQAASIVQGLKLESLQAARFAVLDLSDSSELDAGDSLPLAGRALDFEPETGAELTDEPAAAVMMAPAAPMRPAFEL